MSRYQIRVIEQIEHLIEVVAEDAHQALTPARLQQGEVFERTSSKITYGQPILLNDTNDEDQNKSH
ncbi:MAG: hypothetical protein U5M23_03115 [Marinagarivorans sp.]|nr:hypothetical protein [Marinagarivorans sp.]